MIKLKESQLRSMVMEATRQALKGMKGATKDVQAKANEQSPEEKKYNRATSKPKSSHWKPLSKNDYENMRNGNVDGLSDKAVNMLHATMNNDDKAYRKAKYGELKESKGAEEGYLSIEEIRNLVTILKENPIEEMWKPRNLGFCMVQRVDARSTGTGPCSILNQNEDGSDDLYEEEINGITIIEVGRMPNVPWYEESGAAYMAWKPNYEDRLKYGEPVKLSESQLKKLIMESTKRALNEMHGVEFYNGYAYATLNEGAIKELTEALIASGLVSQDDAEILSEIQTALASEDDKIKGTFRCSYQPARTNCRPEDAQEEYYDDDLVDYDTTSLDQCIQNLNVPENVKTFVENFVDEWLDEHAWNDSTLWGDVTPIEDDRDPHEYDEPVKLSESQLKHLVMESVKKVLRESANTNRSNAWAYGTIKDSIAQELLDALVDRGFLDEVEDDAVLGDIFDTLSATEDSRIKGYFYCWYYPATYWEPEDSGQELVDFDTDDLDYCISTFNVSDEAKAFITNFIKERLKTCDDAEKNLDWGEMYFPEPSEPERDDF